jgi:hypothetical protein
VTCPACQAPAGFKGYRPKTAECLLGTIRYRRGYYHCGRCGSGVFPFDDEAGLGPHRLTPGAERVVCLLGTSCDSFFEAATRVLPEACGLRLAEATVRSVTEDAGKRLGALHERGHTLGDSEPFGWHPDATGRSCGYISLDATGVPQQAKGGGPAEGRMPYVAAIYNPVPERPAEVGSDAPTAVPRPAMQARYVAGLMGLSDLGPLLRRQAGQVGLEQAQRWIGLSDGGNGLEEFLQANFNRADLVVILDFWHAASYLEAVARALFPADEAKRREQTRQRCHTMKHEGGAAILQALRDLEVARHRKALREERQEAAGYIENNLHRMDYPRYVSHGWQIGSGPIESACKSVVGQRLKLAGMRWREDGTDNVCHLRALFKSAADQWDAFWERDVN